MNYQILIADDHPLFRRALEEAIQPLGDEYEITQADNFDDTLILLEENPDIDLVLLDLKMPGSEGLLGLIQIRRAFPHVGVVIVSATQDAQTVANAMREGASGYVPKSTRFEKIQEAIPAVLSGKKWLPKELEQAVADAKVDETAIQKLSLLTPKQLRVLVMIGKGYLNKQIGAELDIKETTIKTHVSEILRKLEIKNRTQAALFTQFLDVDD